MKKNHLVRLKIGKLFGYQSVDIKFDSRVKILIGENGLGKTTVLNMLYYILEKKFEELYKIKFDSIELIFSNKKRIFFTYSDLTFYLDRPKKYQSGQFYQIISKQLTPKDVDEIKSIIENKNIKIKDRDQQISDKLRKVGVNIEAPSQFIYDNIRKLISEFEAIKFQQIIEQINTEIQSKILYFPTYRRVESQIDNITTSAKQDFLEEYPFLSELDFDKIYNKEIIQFGMDDVNIRIKNITSEITQKSLIGFSNITGDLLGQLSKGFPNPIGKRRKDHDKLKIVLGRVGDRISEDDKKNIIDYIKSGETTNKGLLYLIDKLMELYDGQESLDKAIKEFRDKCNSYLKKKLFVYDESKVSLNIYRENTNEEVELNFLSSGEKQIVSLFSKIYLEKNDDFIVLFDEPELSLSIFWQENLLPDIINSRKCNFLLAVTHSPFIYNNELKEFAIGLDEYFVNQ